VFKRVRLSPTVGTMKERTEATKRIDEQQFSIVRKGYDLHQVRSYPVELEQAFQDIEGH
jgi:hypothetical protein